MILTVSFGSHQRLQAPTEATKHFLFVLLLVQLKSEKMNPVQTTASTIEMKEEEKKTKRGKEKKETSENKC